MNNPKLFEDIYSFLEKNYPNLKNKHFSKTYNHFGSHPQYLFDTPHGHWEGNANDPLPDDHSKRLSAKVMSMIKEAKVIVDITNLGLPSGDFVEAIIEGIRTSKHQSDLLIRILCGRPGYSPDTVKFLQYIKDKIGYSNRSISIFAGIQSVDDLAIPIGWNHSKYVAVDGETILLGGHNYNSEPYFGKNPIFDLSIKLDGPVARMAHSFSNSLWEYVNRYVFESPRTTYSDSLVKHEIKKRLAPEWNPPHNEGPESETTHFNVPVIHTTQPGLGILNDSNHPNPAASAMYYAMGNAKKIIHISQQDLGGKGGSRGLREGAYGVTSGKMPFVAIREHREISNVQYYDVNLFNSLTSNLIKNPSLKVNLLLTNKGAKDENDVEYSYGATVANVFRAFGWFIVKRQKQSEEKAIEIITNQLEIKTIGFRGFNQWQVGKKKIIGNHAKYWSVDDEVCCITSHNMYPLTAHLLNINGPRTAHHQEWGVVLGNNANNVVPGIRHDYFNNLYNYSKVVKFENDFLNRLQEPSGFPD